ncbi:protein FAM219B isoform X4 [Opisthocomus hoazin]|uniref:protein FAM219B isoform X4 n=1 Tax=Opisthocomus hoazin TaxID=30419 RepID=UPI003F5348F3
MATGGGGGHGAASGPGGRGGPGLVRAEGKRPSEATDAVEKRGPYIMSKPLSVHAKLQRRRELAKAALQRQGVLGGPAPHQPKPAAKSDGEPGSRCSSGYSSAEVNQDLSRQLLQDGYHLDEVPDDEDLDLIPPKPLTSSSCPCCFGENLSCVVQ